MDEAPVADTAPNDGEATETAVASTTEPIENGEAAKEEAGSNGAKEGDSTPIAEMMADAEAPPATAAPAGEDSKEAPAAPDAKEETIEAKEETAEPKESSEGQDGDPAAAMEVDKSEPSAETPTIKETKKRVRRVGRTPTRKIPKLEEKVTPAPEGGETNTAQVAAGAVDAATAAIGAVPETPGAVEASAAVMVPQPAANQGVLSKHDEKWHAMFQKLVEFKERNKHTLVPQCYTEDPRLGRWVHYQRVEYWIFQQKGTAKITEGRIARLNHIGFEWDPQKAQWEKMFAKLKEFKKEFSHCRVPKGYDKDWELANWVRNQRLEQANLSKEGKKSRMTPERFKLLDELGFKWSNPTPARARRNRQVQKKPEVPAEVDNNGLIKIAPAPEVKPEAAVPAEDGKASETTDAAQAEAVTAATNVVGNLSTVETSTAEETNGVAQDAVEGKTADGETATKTEPPAEDIAIATV